MNRTQFPRSFRPINGVVAPGSKAAYAYRSRVGVLQPVQPEAIAPGIRATPSHDLIFHGGKTIADLAFVDVYVGGASAWQQSDIAAIDGALSAAMSDAQLNNVMQQYFPGQALSGTFAGSMVLGGAAPGTMTKAGLEALIAQLYSNGQLDGHALDRTVFNILLPSGTILSDDDPAAGNKSDSAHLPKGMPADDAADSLNGLGGYHGSNHFPLAGGGADTVYYAVGVYSEVLPDGRTNGIPVFAEPWKNVVATFYHEMNEVRTDADVEDAIRAGNDPGAVSLLGWTSRQGEECGDFPVFEAQPLSKVFKEVALTSGGSTVPVQFQYSNAVHGPEGPIAQPHHQGRHVAGEGKARKAG